MFFSQKKFFSFLLLVNLLFTNSFILAYEMPGDVWNFTTAPIRTPTTPVPPTPPTPPTDPPTPPAQGGGSSGSQTQFGEVWSFTTAPIRTPDTPTPPTPPAPPQDPPAPPAQGEGSSSSQTQFGEVWSFTTAPYRTPTTPTPPTPPAPPQDPPAPPAQGEGSSGSQTQFGDVWNFTTRDGPKGTDLKIESKTYCAPAPAGQGIIGFKWTYKDEGEKNQTGYDFRVNDINNVNDPNPEIDRQVRELNNPSDTINTQSVMVKYPLETDKITFNKLYYWWVKVYNTEGGDSGWINGRYFYTPNHAYPYPDFVVSPTKPVINKPVEFKQDSAETGATCYQTEGAEILCQNSASAGYKWDFIYNTGIDSTTKGNATTSYNATGTYETMLEITDNVGACAAFKSFEVKDKNASSFSLPRWKEISP